MQAVISAKRPFVYIVGAGPGNPDLLTVKAYQLLTGGVDVVVYDRLVHHAILDLIPKHVKVIYAGKSCRNHHMRQEDINALLVKEAQAGHVVVRLKGGDPFIFGRGGEEALYLAEHHIDFEIVPGINAADGCCAYQGIPLTHRDLARNVLFITGHQQKGKSLDIDFQGLAQGYTTIVVFMGLANLEKITKGLLDAGLVPETPAIAIEHGTIPAKERVCFSTLAMIHPDVVAQQFMAPTLIVIGKVVALASKLAKPRG